MKLTTIFQFVVLCIILFATPVKAQSTTCNIKLNEFLPNPVGTDEGLEWIELFNPCDGSINLEGFYILDNANTKQLLAGTVGPKNFLLINITIGLTNTSDSIRLFSRTNELVDSVTYTNAKEGKSISRDRDGVGEWIDTLPQTPGKTNITLYSDQIALSEIFPFPDKSKEQVEWIELFNNSNSSVDLTNWLIADTTSTFALSQTTIGPKQFLVIENPDLKISLNDKEDSVSLKSPDGKLISVMNYQESIKGTSFIILDNQILSTKQPTSGAKNIFVDVNDCFFDLDKISIQNLIDTGEDQDGNYMTEGIVTLQNSNFIYIQDKTAGMPVRLPDKKTALQPGTFVKVAGYTKDTANAYTSLVVHSNYCVKTLAMNKKLSPTHIDLYENLGLHQYQLVNIKGTITQNAASSFVIQFDGHLVQVKLNDSTKNTTRQKSDIISITGVLTKASNPSSEDEPTYIVIPRVSGDLSIISDSKQPISHPELTSTTSTSSQISAIYAKPTIHATETDLPEIAIKTVKQKKMVTTLTAAFSCGTNLYNLWFVLRNLFWT